MIGDCVGSTEARNHNSILQGSTWRCESEHAVPVGLLGTKAIRAVAAVRLNKQGLPDRNCDDETLQVLANISPRSL